jgi:hypothetical protein
LTSNWNDYGGEEFRELNYYGYAWTAECAWQPEKADVNEFNKVFFKDLYGTSDDDKLRSIYAILSSPANCYSWHELWRHPMLPLRQQSQEEGYPPIVERLESIKTTMPLVLSLLAKEKVDAAKQDDRLRYLEFVARLNLWFAKKIEAGETVKRLSQSPIGSVRNDSTGIAIVEICNDVQRDLSSLKSEFERLWLATNQSAGLELLLTRYDHQGAYWQEIIDRVNRGVLWENGEIQSLWIYHPETIPGKNTSTQVQRAFFRKTFIAPNGVRSATLQLIGNTYARLLLNGKFVGEVYVRRSNSLSIEQQRTKVFDVLPLLTDSTNVVTVEAQSFEPANSAGINVYCELQLVDGTIRKLMSDTTWKVSDAPMENWSAISFVDSSWSMAAAKPYPLTIVRPNFETGRSSWIER